MVIGETNPAPENSQDAESGSIQERLEELLTQVSSVVLGKREAIRLALVALLAQGHVLIEDLPGVGKTLVGKALAKAIAGEFCIIQLTPDMLPSDIIGSTLYNSQSGEFVYKPGPLFANVVLADEINRTTPRTQSALLEAMSDNQVSVDGVTHPLPQPFIVIATQNPYEFEGTYPLPESQLDRFLLRMRMGYPKHEEELQILFEHRDGEPVDRLEPVVDAAAIVELQQQVRQVGVERSISEYLLAIVHATRNTEELHIGVSTRGALALYRATQALALLERRNYVVPDDVKQLAVPVLAHRVISRGFLHGGQRDAVEGLIQRLVDQTPVPS